ncbi:MAG TPA: alpha/beta hydrolase [Pseudonocardiaceae bacterium]
MAGGFALAACSSTTASSSPAAPKLAACPQESAVPGAPAAGAATPTIPVAKTVAPTDTSTSVVINPTGSQIRCGRTALTTTTNVVYATPTTNGKQTQLKLDIQVPRTAGRKPLVVYLTGGGFMIAGQAANLGQRTYVAEQGYVVASIQYRTIPNGANYSDAVADVKSAIRYLRAHAGQYGIDGSHVAVWGQSAGGYLAAMTGVTNGLKQFDVGANLDRSSDVQAVVDEFGPSNLSKVGDDYDTAAKQANLAPGNNLALWVYGPGTTKSVAQYTPQVAAADPTTYVGATTPPFVLLQGSNDELVSPSQTLLMHNALTAKGVPNTRYVVAGANHGDLVFAGNTSIAAWSTQVVMGRITGFLGRRLAA